MTEWNEAIKAAACEPVQKAITSLEEMIRLRSSRSPSISQMRQWLKVIQAAAPALECCMKPDNVGDPRAGNVYECCGNPVLKRPADDGWQTMESAPKDGTRIQLFAEGCLEDGSGVVIGNWYKHPSIQGWITPEFDCGDYDFSPTHWRPLPPAPVNHKEG